MSPAQSEDSGLAPDRGTTYATITLPRDSGQNMGITFAGEFGCNNKKLKKLALQNQNL